MHLKSIELYGFKSFANKMVFKFDQGITAIVGPNGSGKSNVSDAVRWVLGETSAKALRGGKMQDVIFAGTEARKPLGYCQVDLTIDNHDKKMPIEYSEVTVSRRVYRSGEGEYFINGTQCRMRDVHELFMDTGVGQEGYSIIGQGQIDKILSNKPNERRALFDEAVGIVKFKKRMERAEKRLEEEKQNLYRVNDIITELEGQKETLMDQAEKAKTYLNIKETLKTNEVNVFILDVKAIDERLEELKEKMAGVQTQIRHTRNTYQENKLKHEAYSQKMATLVAEMDDIRAKATALSLQKEKKESDISLTSQQISHLKDNNNRFTKDMSTLKTKEAGMGEELEAYKANIQSIFDESAKSDVALKAHEAELTAINEAIAKEEAVVGTIQANMIEHLNELSNIRTEMQRYQTMSENTALRAGSITARKSLLEASHNQFKELLAKETDKKKTMVLEGKTLTREREALIESQRKEGEALQKAENDRQNASQELQRLESKHKALSDISEQYEGYNFSIRKVMEKRSDSHYGDKIIGVVADILSVDKAHERAIEIALGGSYQNIITEDEQTAKGLIRFLKEKRFGRATFLPLTNINPKVSRQESLRQAKGFIGFGDELVTVEDRFKKIAAYLLGRTVIVRHIDDAVALARTSRNFSRIVTLEGDVVNPGGAMTGGAFKNNSTQFLSRKRELKTLEATIETRRAQLASAKESHQTLLARREEATETLKTLTEKIQALSMALNSQNMKIHQIDSDMTKCDVELEELVLEEENLLSQKGQLTGQISALDDVLKENEVNREQAETTVKEGMAKTAAMKEKKEQVMADMTKLKVSHTALVEQRSHAQSNIDRMNREISDAKGTAQKLEEEMAQNRRQIEEKEALIIRYREEVLNFAAIIDEVNGNIHTMTEERQHLSREQDKLYKVQEEVGEKITLLEKELLRLENQENKNSLQKETYIHYMWEEYELTYNNALTYFEEELGSIGVIKKRVEALKSDIKALGVVNVNAIEDYRSVSERYEFLTTQRDDIIEAETKLRKAIEELDEQMQQQFKEQFALINTEFQKVFKELFGGGKAFLRLSDEANVLEAGIHINVQPPGKKLQSMMLLSGGERAFTAIALLFAIQNLKPSPFCVLDEIEAALDDANVDRFAKYLQKLTCNTQFIIITHRRGTMEASDALYGITMQEKGISTQVSVKLIEDTLEV